MKSKHFKKLPYLNFVVLFIFISVVVLLIMSHSLAEAVLDPEEDTSGWTVNQIKVHEIIQIALIGSFRKLRLKYICRNKKHTFLGHRFQNLQTDSIRQVGFSHPRRSVNKEGVKRIAVWFVSNRTRYGECQLVARATHKVFKRIMLIELWVERGKFALLDGI